MEATLKVWKLEPPKNKNIKTSNITVIKILVNKYITRSANTLPLKVAQAIVQKKFDFFRTGYMICIILHIIKYILYIETRFAV